MLYLIIGGCVIILIIIGIILTLYYKNKYTFLYIRVNEAENNLDILLQKKEEILLKINNLLEKKEIKDLPDIIKLKSKKLDHHTLYTELSNITNDITKIIDEIEDKIMDRNLQKLLDLLNDNENDLRAAIKYYNDNATDINYYAHRFPSNLIKYFSHYPDTELYTISKRESFAILKNN